MTMFAPSPRRHWAQIRERGAYLGLLLMLGAYRVLGRCGFIALLYPVVGYFFATDRAARRASLEFLRRVHDCSNTERPASRPGWRESFRHFLSFGAAIGDKVAAWAGDIGLADISLENDAVFKALQKEGRGAILIASHLGNVEVCRAIASAEPSLRITALVHTRHSLNFSRLLRQVAPDSSVSVVQTTEIGPATAMFLSARVAAGEFIVIAGDRTPAGGSSRVAWASFLGRPAPFPAGPFILAGLLGCPVQLLFCLKDGGRHRLIFEPFSEGLTLPRRNRSQALESWARQYAARLEHYSLLAPMQWFNFFDFWNQAPGPTTVGAIAGKAGRQGSRMEKAV